MTNRLANETSPYLLQHKDNPVDWYPWGEEAFARARAEDKPIFLSIGYSSCHWCHVMARESFEDEETAALLNDNFVSVKVDREERPDLDSIFMTAVQGMTGQGGWPLSAFLTPDGEPFYTGTYYPPERREGMPSFRDILGLIIRAYREHRDDLLQAGRQVAAYIKGQTRVPVSGEPLSNQVLHKAYGVLASNFDAEHGGFGHAPKFPQPTLDEFLLRYWHATGDARAIAMAELTLDRMARGGLRDQIGGGFHRYSTDTSWLVPHFEKMLYSNALLAMAYLHLWQATGKQFGRQVVEDTLAYVEREMLDPGGAFYSAQDADSEEEEGKFFVWEAGEVDRLLGLELSRVARLYYGMTDGGNFHGRNVLSTPLGDEEAAHLLDMSVPDLQAAVAEVRARLRAEREKRVPPARDEKAVTAWNALMLKAFAEAGAALADEGYVDIARRNAEFILTSLIREGRLLRTWRATPEGGSAKLGGYLEDYAFFIEALLSLYEATFEPRWLIEATQLAHTMLDLFWDADAEAFFDTARDHEQLVVRPRNVFDNTYPSGGSAATLALLKLAVFNGDEDLERYAVRSLYSVRGLMDTAAAALSNWLAALDFHLSAPQEIVIVGPRGDQRTKALLAVCYDRYLPNKVVAGAEGRQDTPISPLLADRGLVDGLPTAYVCEDYRCDLPATEPVSVVTLLSGRRGRI